MAEVRKKDLSEPTTIDKLTVYLKGVRAEWDKVTWPEKKQVVVETIIVLCVVFFFTFLVYIYDVIFEFMFKLIPAGG